MLDIAELSPNFDPSGITARIDCHWIAYVLSAYAAAIEAGEVSGPGHPRRAARATGNRPARKRR